MSHKRQILSLLVGIAALALLSGCNKTDEAPSGPVTSTPPPPTYSKSGARMQPPPPGMPPAPR